MTTYDIFFSILGILCAASGLAAVTTRHLMHAALWLTVCLATLAGCYLVLGAELVALVQLLVYVGAIVVLVLFALMLTRAPIGRSHDHDTPLLQRAVALVIAGSAGVLLGIVLITGVRGGTVRVHGGSTNGLARMLFSTWVWPFELLSLLLLAALVGALAMSRSLVPARATRRTGEDS
ncbi:NADH-quinone oxidoreductase subunit J [Allobranchiibius sp. GilTou73]|uniref:NADH-quinone oxidoreductase subunit J family protein n=1 Tax=Allobranchiibius sp. GilTou73 TaxID=2904523 RepID=UPI001F1D55AF|nr:NADH-quinone oxidoreductase subunit J [Allobranchiibius sp. GilTou73]UIJ36074.1 NADH-quinone oxidoreductase subunit J [Allobranchiibius sp. GilTou73]